MSAIARKSGTFLATLLVVAYCTGPLVWALLTSLKPEADLTRLPPILPRTLSGEHYASVFDPSRHFGRLLLNSLIVAGTTTVVSVLIGAAAAFALVMLPLPGKRLLLGAALVAALLPPIATVSPLFLLLRALRLRDTLSGLILVDTAYALPLALWTLTQVFRALPEELYRAARVDGCTPYGAFLRVLLPLALPGVATSAILVFVFAWNEFLFALTFTATDRARTVPVGIAQFAGMYEVPWGELSAASVVVTIPLVIVVLIFQKRIIAGVTAGAVKG